MNMILTAILVAPFLSNTTLDKESKEAAEAFQEIYYGENTEEVDRLLAIQQLANVPHDKTAEVLGGLLFHAPESHKVEAAIALGNFHEIRGISSLVTGALLAPANRKNTELRVALVKTSGSLLDLSSLPILHMLINDSDLPVALAAIDTIPSFEREESIMTLKRGSEKAGENADSSSLKRRMALQKALRDLRDNLDGK